LEKCLVRGNSLAAYPTTAGAGSPFHGLQHSYIGDLVSHPNTWHTGSLDGTSTLLVRRCDGLTWAVVFNTRKATRKQEPADAIDALVHRAANAVKRWP
jgi:hypothetical protein